ncbi:MAG: hypothetical protein ACOY46_07115 [Bacillota bacterium]
MIDKIKHWFEKYFEEPMYQAELNRASILTEKSRSKMMVSLAGSLSHNYDTLRSW